MSIEHLPQQLQNEILQNSRDMKNFYTYSVEKREQILDRIAGLNTKEEFEKAKKKL